MGRRGSYDLTVQSGLEKSPEGLRLPHQTRPTSLVLNSLLSTYSASEKHISELFTAGFLNTLTQIFTKPSKDSLTAHSYLHISKQIPSLPHSLSLSNTHTGNSRISHFRLAIVHSYREEVSLNTFTHSHRGMPLLRSLVVFTHIRQPTESMMRGAFRSGTQNSPV